MHSVVGNEQFIQLVYWYLKYLNLSFYTYVSIYQRYDNDQCIIVEAHTHKHIDLTLRTLSAKLKDVKQVKDKVVSSYPS